MTGITILGRYLPAYGLLGVLGMLSGLVLSLLRCRRFGLSRDDAAYIYVFSALFCILGAKLLYLLTVSSSLFEDLVSQKQNVGIIISKYILGGFVFYGGLAGAAAGIVVFSRWFGKNTYAAFSALVPSFPLAHAFGRLGCYTAGCCYGIKTDSALFCVYNNSLYAPNGVHLVPVQLIEAGAEFIIFIFLLFYTGKKRECAYSMQIYILIYSPLRFILEFFRGDEDRGFIFDLSTSQFISILFFVLAILWIILEKYQVEKSKVKAP